MIKIGICDDDKVFCQQLETIIKSIGREQKKNIAIELFQHGQELVESICGENNYDVLFLDISMPEMNGIQVGKFLREQRGDDCIKIIYISSEPGYALNLFKIRPVDFILKPIQEAEVRKVMEIVFRLIGSDSQYFSFDMGKEHFRIPVSTIMYFQSSRRKIQITAKQGEYAFYSTLEDVEKKLGSRKFIRIHKSYLINYDKAIKIDYAEVVMEDGKVLPISQANRKEVRARCLELEGGKK